MNCTLIYATYSNSTYLASEYLAEQLTAAGYQVELLLASQVTPEQLLAAQFLLLASPSWDYQGEQGMPHEDFLDLKNRLGSVKLANTPMAIMGLGDSGFTYYCGAVAHLADWFTALGAEAVVEPLKIDQYYVNEAAAKTAIETWAKRVAAVMSAEK